MASRCWRVTGRVQGVGYRAFARFHAEALGLSGWARNLPDGSVEVAARGPEAALGAFEALLREGPPRSGVRALVASEPLQNLEEAAGFEIRYGFGR